MTTDQERTEQEYIERSALYAGAYYYAQLKRPAYTEAQRKVFADMYADHYSAAGLLLQPALTAFES